MPFLLRGLLVACLLFSCLESKSNASADRTFVTAQSHLPKTIFPQSYDIWLAPNLAERVLQGKERIRLRFTEPSSTVSLYSLETRFIAIAIDGATPVSMQLFDATRGLWRLRFARRFAAGVHTLSIAYTGKIQEHEQMGMFIAHSREGASVATQMEPTAARRVFPGWDEPIYKARFHLTVVIPKNFTAVSNMPVASVRPASAFEKTVTFQITPPMSSYLVAVCAGGYAHTHSNCSSPRIAKSRTTLY